MTEAAAELWNDAAAEAARRQGRLRAEPNQHCSAADGVAHTLKPHATPHGVAHVMLELRHDLLAAPEDAEAVAEGSAPLLVKALGALTRTKGAA